MSKKRKSKNKRTINIQKIFCFISFIFLLVCTLWYGGRTIYYYLDSKKEVSNNKLLASQLLKDNLKSNTFKKVGKNYYFYKDANNNYLTYSNIVWRIVKITNNNEILLITDTPITNLAFGSELSLKESYPIKWMNKNDNDIYSGVLENNITNIKDYLIKTKTCINDVKDIKKIKCTKENNDNYFSLLDIKDYINTGYNESFINNNYYNYLANKNGSDIWYINTEGELETNDGSEIIGIKPTITLKSNTTYIDGNGTKDSPYILEEKTGYFASYVKLDEDIYRVYNIKEDIIKLSLNDYLKIDNEKYEYIYSNNNYYHNDTKYYSLANYLNTTYLDTLKYKDLILSNKYNNYYYGEDTNYDYEQILNNKIDTKVYTLSIGDPILNNLNNYFLATGTNENNSLIYIEDNNGSVTKESVTEKKYIIPCISINTKSLTKGAGTLKDPYRTE